MANAKILIVEDESIAALDLENRLESLGYSVAAVAASGEEAIQQAAETRPDMVLMDIRLKGDMDGIEAAQEIRARFDIPVVYLTALADDDTLRQAKITEPLGYVLKPFEDRELYKTIEIALHKHTMERKLRESEQWLATTLRSISDAVIAIGKEGFVMFMNSTAEALTGWGQEAALGRDWKKVFNIIDEETGTPESSLARALEEGIAVGPADHVLIAKDGTETFIDDSAAPIRDEKGDIIGFVLVFRDITGRKWAEGVLRGSEEHFRALIENASDIITVLDGDGVISYLSPSIGRMLEYKPDELIGKNAFELLHPDDAPRLIDALVQIIQNPALILSAEFRFRHRDGSHRFFEGIGRNLLDDPVVAGIVINARDITERVQLEERLGAIYRLGQELTLLRDEDAIVQRVLETAADVLQFKSIDYALVDEAAGELAYQHRIINGALETAESRLPLDGERGISVAVARSGQVLNVPDVTQDARYVSGPGDQPGRSELCVPMKVGERIIGVLNAESVEPGRFTPADQQLLQALANQTAVAVENARLYRAIREQVARLATLNAISTAAVSSLELDTVLRQVLELTCQALDAVEGAILLSEPDMGGLFFALTLADDDSSGGLRGQHVAPGQGIAGWVAQHDQPVYVNDVRRDPRWYEGVDAATGFETRSLCCAPLRYRGKVAGVIEIVNKREGAFTGDDLSLLEAVSSIAAAALDSTRLYMATQARADELVLLNEIGLALTSTLDFSTVVHAALSQVQRLFRAENVSLLQPDLQTGELCFVRALVGRTPVEVPVRLQPGEGIAGWALEHRQPVLIKDAQADPRFSDRVDQHLQSPTRAVMAVPLLMAERSIGVIEVTSSQPDAYTRDELRTLQALASTLAVALDNAHLYDELKTLLRERERAQAQLIHSEKVAALGRLAASIAHEINNPLQAVQGCLALAEEELDGRQRREKMDRYLDIAGSEIERIAAIVLRMRNFYRPAREGLQPTDLHGVLESVLELTNGQLQHSDIAVERCFQKGAEPLPMIRANADQLKQVFLNLVLNGIDAMPAGGTLRMSTGLDQMAAGGGQRPRPAMRIEFSDTGEGMPPEVLSHLFEPFFTTKEHGSGLGLSISYGIIQSHGGEITVTSQVGVGTTFTILLPVEQP